MIITLICTGLLVIGIILWIINDNLLFKISSVVNSILVTLIIIALIIGTLGSFISCISSICNKIEAREHLYTDKIEYESLLDRIELVGSESVYAKSELVKDIAEWNKYVTIYKKRYNSPWTNWYYSKELAEYLQYIDIDIE